jgi:pimeloyl-ACP methyl ester carboxylesterase
MPPTIVLVHGAFAESASWDRVIRQLEDAGRDVIAAANPLRGLAADAAAVSDLVRTVDGPVVLAGHSFHDQFAADVPAAEAARMAAAQRPVTLEALQEPAGERPLWKELPSWFLIGGRDRNIPSELQHQMAHRAGARRTIELPTASHAVAVSHPDATARLILEAAAPLRAAA